MMLKSNMAETDKVDAIYLAEIDRMRVKHLADSDKCTIFALYINDYGEEYDIVQA